MENSYGVVIGRFQPFHEGHKWLMTEVLSRHQRLMVIVGEPPVPFSSRSPLPTTLVQDIICTEMAEFYPRMDMNSVLDQPTHELWSHTVDRQIESTIGSKKAVLYGSRDSFIQHYKGKYKTEELSFSNPFNRLLTTTHSFESSTQIRLRKSITFPNLSTSLEDALIWAAERQYPAVISTVDIAVFIKGTGPLYEHSIALIRKANETKWRLPGGFADVNSDSFAMDAVREFREECGDVEIGGAVALRHVGSYNIDDWRYRSEKNKIRTTLFCGQYVFGNIQAGDDAAEARWFNISSIPQIMPNHELLVQEAIKFYGKGF